MLGVSSYSSVIVVVNSPPSGGIFLINPLRGFELITTFDVSANLWYDVDLPLQYTFGLVTSVGSLLLAPISEIPYRTAIYPAGLNSNGYNITAVSQVYDSYLAYSVELLSVHVTPSNLSGNALLTLGISSLQ